MRAFPLPKRLKNIQKTMEKDGLSIKFRGVSRGYRNVSWKFAFPFGHGLSYSRFEYGSLAVEPCEALLCLRATVRNVGEKPSRTVAQLYVEFPKEAKQPTAILKGFQKTAILQPGAVGHRDFTRKSFGLAWFGMVLPPESLFLGRFRGQLNAAEAPRPP